MTRLVLILSLAAAALTGCQVDEATLGGTVVGVAESDLGREPSSKLYEDPLVPEVAWKINVQLDDGAEVTVIHNGDRRYTPGDRVYVLRGDDGELLL